MGFISGAGFFFEVGEGATTIITPIVTPTEALPTTSDVSTALGLSFGDAIMSLATAVAAKNDNGLMTDTVTISSIKGMMTDTVKVSSHAAFPTMSALTPKNPISTKIIVFHCLFCSLTLLCILKSFWGYHLFHLGCVGQHPNNILDDKRYNGFRENLKQLYFPSYDG